MSKNITLVIIILLIVLGGWYYVSHKTDTQVMENTDTSTETLTKEFSLVIADNKIVGEQTTLQVRQGDTVVLHITSDIEEELHIHGYDVSAELTPAEPATIEFVADVSGRFPFELEESKIDLGAIEVAPQ